MTSSDGRKTQPVGEPAACLYIKELAWTVILVLIFKAFIADAYVIPTGSMAPTLYGEHLTRQCGHCGYTYAGEVRQVDPNSNQRVSARRALCPNCRNQIDAAPVDATTLEGGDRILALKLGYELTGLFPSLNQYLGPKRWDVVVFKNPSDPDILYIKRLIGLPGEKLEVIDGDVYINDRIARKSPNAQGSLWFPVYDLDYLPRDQGENDPGWTTESPADAAVWNTRSRQLSFKCASPQKAGTLAFNGSITDFYAYDDPDYGPNGHFVVSDLKLQFVLIPGQGSGQLDVALGKRNDIFVARVYTDGQVGLFRRPRRDFFLGQSPMTLLAQGKINPLKTHVPVTISFENVDYRVRLMVNGRVVLETTDEQYHPTLARLRTQRLEMVPPIVQVRAGGFDGELDHVKLMRDVYYQPVMFTETRNERGEINPLLRLPGHGVVGNPIRLGPTDYFVLGDNSPESKDSRLWWEVGKHLARRYRNHQYQLGTVPADQMVARAVFVVLPARFRLAGTALPIIPDIGTMRFIR